MGAVLAFGACLSWGWGTHVAARWTAEWGTLRVTGWSQLAGLAPMLPWLLLTSHALSPADVSRGVIAGVGAGTSLALLYHACMRMSPGLAAAVAGVTGAVIPLIYTVAASVPLSPLAVAALIPCVAGVGIVVRAHDHERPVAGGRLAGKVAPYEAALSGAAMGVYYVALSQADDPAVTVGAARAAGAALLLTVVLAMASRHPRPTAATLAGVTLTGVLGAVGGIAYAYAASLADLVSVVAIVSVAPVVTAMIGRWQTDERLDAMQRAGLVVCVAGAALAGVSIIGT